MQFSAPVVDLPVAAHGFQDNNVLTPSLVVPDLLKDQVDRVAVGWVALGPYSISLCRVEPTGPLVPTGGNVTGADLRAVSFASDGSRDLSAVLAGNWRNLGHDVGPEGVSLFVRRF